MTDWKALFHAHIETLTRSTAAILDELGLSGLVLGAGSLSYYFEDDQARPFRTAHHYARWSPHQGEESLLHFVPGRKPRLILFAPEDYWYEFPELGNPFWADEFDVVQRPTVESVWKEVSALPSNTAYEGPDTARALDAGLKIHVPTLVDRLNWERSFKTPYEVAAIQEATRIAAGGHIAARDTFLNGGSELDCHFAFLSGCRITDEDLAYPTIIGIDRKAAILHYHGKRRERPEPGGCLLIDAGVRYNNYSSDITRTYASDKAHPAFKRLVSGLDQAQQEMIRRIRPGHAFADMHLAAHKAVGELLIDVGVLKDFDADAAVESGLTNTFLPHGFGHLLGILVHDVAGKQQDPAGTPFPKTDDVRFRHLRSFRKADPGLVFTVEPGIYFIDILLRRLKASDAARHVDWDLVGELARFGGIRIEDNVLVKEAGVENLTRPYLP